MQSKGKQRIEILCKYFESVLSCCVHVCVCVYAYATVCVHFCVYDVHVRVYTCHA